GVGGESVVVTLQDTACATGRNQCDAHVATARVCVGLNANTDVFALHRGGDVEGVGHLIKAKLDAEIGVGLNLVKQRGAGGLSDENDGDVDEVRDRHPQQIVAAIIVNDCKASPGSLGPVNLIIKAVAAALNQRAFVREIDSDVGQRLAHIHQRQTG